MAFQLPPINFTPNSARNKSVPRIASFERIQPTRLYPQGQLDYSDMSGHQRSPSLNLGLIQNIGVQSPLLVPREINQVIPTHPFGDSRLQNINQQQPHMSSRRDSFVQGFTRDQTPRRVTLLPLLPFQQDPSSPFSPSYFPTSFPTPQFETQSPHVLQSISESTFKKAHDQAVQEQEKFGALLERHARRQSTLLLEMAGSFRHTPKSETKLSLPHLEGSQNSKSDSWSHLESPPREEEQFDSIKLTQPRRPTHFNPDSNITRRSSNGNEMLQALLKARLEHESKKSHFYDQEDQSETTNEYFSENDLNSPRSEMSGNSAQQTPKSEGKRYSGASLLSLPHKKSSFFSNEGSQKFDLDPQRSKKSSFRFERPNEPEQSPLEPKNEEDMIRRQAAKRATWRLLKQRGSIMITPQAPQEEEKIETLVETLQGSIELEDTSSQNQLSIKNESQTEITRVKKKKKTKKKTKILDSQSNKQKAQNQIKVAVWLTIFIPLAFEEKKRQAFSQKIHMEEDVMSRVPRIYSLLKDFIVEHAGKEILTLLLNKQSNLIFVSTKVLPEKRLNKDCLALKEQLQKIFSSLVENLSFLSNDVFELFAALSKNNALLPSFLFSEFELNRLRFGYFGTLRQVSIEQTNLICGAIAIIRVLIHTVIMEPWSAFHLSQEKFDIEKVFNVGSVMYNIAMELLRSTANLVDSQQPISASYKVQPKKKLLTAFSNPSLEKSFVVRKDLSRDGEIITGFYSKQQLACFFTDRKRIVQELKEQMQELLDGFNERIHNNE